MKKVIAVFALVFVAGILAGGAYEWLSTRGAESAAKNSSSVSEEPLEPAAAQPEPGSSSGVAADAKTARPKKKPRVTNPDKICSTPGCGRAVFVTYKGKELCVKCYGDAKNLDTRNQ